MSKLFPPLPPLASKERAPDEDCAWLQDAAFDVLQANAVQAGTFTSSWTVYYALVIVASQFDADVTPEHDGRPFTCNIARLARGSFRSPPALNSGTKP
jgi:hypothetical protein